MEYLTVGIVSDRLVFVLAIGPWAMTSALAATRTVVKLGVPQEAGVAVIPGLEDSLFEGKEADVSVTAAAGLGVCRITDTNGFTATNHGEWREREQSR